MNIFKRKSNNRSTNVEFNCTDVYILTTTILSSYNDGMGCGPRSVKWYFLSTKRENEYYELFSDKKFEKESRTTFDEPLIEKIEPLKDYLKDKNQKTINIQSLFEFITLMNVKATIANSTPNEDGEDFQE